MRRDLNFRKRKRNIYNENNKKHLKILYILLIILSICIFIYFSFLQNIFIKKALEKDSMNFSNLNQNIPFSIKKITLFSSATAESKSINQQLCLDISQYCDIAVHLTKTQEKNAYISSLYIDNISMSSPEIGTPYLYKKAITDLGKCSFNEKNIINDSLSFNIIDLDADIDYKNLEIYNNGNTPITLGFYNKNIKTNFFTNNSEILYNGKLLKDSSVPTASLNCNISFTLNIITTNNEHYICNINFDIPFKNEGKSIYKDGYITLELESGELNKFIRIK